jgi:hypothetical protein
MTEAAKTTEGIASAEAAEAGQAGESGEKQQATAVQDAGGGKAETAKLGGDQESKPSVPEKYEFRAPEGLRLDDAVLGAFSEVAKELALPQDAAQKVIDKMAPVFAARQAEQLKALSESWVQASVADKEFGGEKIAEHLAVAKKALDELATPELRKLLDETGLGNHPEVIRVFYRAGKRLSEDTVVGGRRTASPTGDIRSLYPNSDLK